MSSRPVCDRCNRSFRDGVALRRHQNRARPCEATKASYHCVCGKSYANRSNLYRHSQECQTHAVVTAPSKGKDRPLAAKVSEPALTGRSPVVVQNITNTIQHIQVNTLGHHQQVSVSPVGQLRGVVTTVQAPSEVDPLRFPGWPAKWPAPQTVPTTFKPLGFEISQPELEAAVGSLTAGERESCARGDTLGVSRLLVEILKRVHSDPKERNVYLNPARADQALVFIPSSWSAQPLEEAAQSMFARIRVLLNEAGGGSEQEVQSAVVGASRGCVGKLPQLARVSRGQLSAHLENVRRATVSGEDWLGTGGEPSEQPAFIGKEHAGHLDASMLIPALEQASGAYAAGDLREEEAPGRAAKALAECARYILHARPTNLTVLERGGELYAHEHEAGWVPWPRARAAAAILQKAAWVLNDRLHGVPSSPLVALRPWLQGRRLAEVLESPQGAEAAERVLWHYTAAAARYYGALPRVRDPHDRREAARRLIAGETGEPPPAPAALAPAAPLTRADLEALLGFSLQ